MADSGGEKEWDMYEKQYFVNNILPWLRPGMKAENMVQFGIAMQNVMAMVYPVNQRVYTGECMYQYWCRNYGPYAKGQGAGEREASLTLTGQLGPLGLPMYTLPAHQRQIRHISGAQLQPSMSSGWLQPPPIMKLPIPRTKLNSDEERDDIDMLIKVPRKGRKRSLKKEGDYDSDYNPFTGATRAGSPLPMDLRKRRNHHPRRFSERVRRNSVSQHFRR